jgi:hypothetical protein
MEKSQCTPVEKKLGLPLTDPPNAHRLQPVLSVVDSQLYALEDTFPFKVMVIPFLQYGPVPPKWLL